MSEQSVAVAVKVLREERIVELEVTGAPFLTDYGGKLISPESLIITYYLGREHRVQNRVDVRGWGVRKDGTVGASPRSARFWDGRGSDDSTSAPSWLLDLIEEYRPSEQQEVDRKSRWTENYFHTASPEEEGASE